MFRVIVGGDPLGSFLKVSGIGYSVEPYELKEGVEFNTTSQTFWWSRKI